MLIQWFVSEIKRSLEIWKYRLGVKAVNPLWPKTYLLKLLPKQIAYKEARVEFMKKRIFNRALDKVSEKFRGFATINTDCIIPMDDLSLVANGNFFVCRKS